VRSSGSHKGWCINLLERFQRFMYGRYGGDGLNLFLMVVGMVLSIFGSYLFWPILIVSYLIYFYAIFRIFSRNIGARQREYAVFLRIWNPIRGWFGLTKRKFTERKQYKYFKCPQCHQQLRAPRGRGKIIVTCQKCHSQFDTKT